jgi:hypothetical protein
MSKTNADFEAWISRIESELASDVEPEAWRRHYERGLSPSEAVATDRAERDASVGAAKEEFKYIKPDEITPADLAEAEFLVVAELASGGRWVELTELKHAYLAQALSQTAVGGYMKAEYDHVGGKPPFPHRWFMLLAADAVPPRADVVICLPGEAFLEKALYKRPVHIVAYRNHNAYPKYENEIEELSRAIGIDIPPNYHGSDLTDRERSSPKL